MSFPGRRFSFLTEALRDPLGTSRPSRLPGFHLAFAPNELGGEPHALGLRSQIACASPISRPRLPSRTLRARLGAITAMRGPITTERFGPCGAAWMIR